MSDMPRHLDATQAAGDPLSATIAEARQEEIDGRASREARMSTERAAARQRRTVLNLLLVASAGACVVVLWMTQRVHAPSPDDLAAGRELALSIAADAVREHVARTGAAPASAGAVVPGLPQIRIEPQPGAVMLSLPYGNDRGPTRTVELPTPAAVPAPQ